MPRLRRRTRGCATEESESCRYFCATIHLDLICTATANIAGLIRRHHRNSNITRTLPTSPLHPFLQTHFSLAAVPYVGTPECLPWSQKVSPYPTPGVTDMIGTRTPLQGRSPGAAQVRLRGNVLGTHVSTSAGSAPAGQVYCLNTIHYCFLKFPPPSQSKVCLLTRLRFQVPSW